MEPFAFTPPGGAEMVIILVVVILLFGARKLPELGSSVGKSIKNFKKGLEEGQDEVADGDEAGPTDADAERSADETSKASKNRAADGQDRSGAEDS